MRSTVIWLALLLGLSSCGELDPAAAPQPQQAALSGTWALSHTQLSNDCGGEGELFPLAPGDVQIEQRDGQVTLRSTDEPPRSYTAAPDRWTRQLSEQVETCQVTLSETWRLHSVSHSQLSATYAAALELSGECAFTGLASCAVRHAVWGVRR